MTITGLGARTQAEAEAELLACCASPAWAAEVAARRPYHDLETLRRVSDAVLAALDWPEVLRAVQAHPRIGERRTGEGREAAWSREEQSTADSNQEELAQANAEYERRFGHVFLICATGLTSEQVLAALRERLGNDEDAERGVVREELRKIVSLRLGKL
jgi:2-oxo-4-hydroxy-4-carboxy-5-ureidoimidazoline decarboxylase